MNVRDVAYEVLDKIEQRQRFSNEALRDVLANRPLHPLDRNLLVELVYGCLKWRAFLDRVIDDHVKRGISSVSRPGKLVLRLGIYQLLLLDRIPPRAAVHEAVRQARRFGGQPLSRFTNAVLRRIAGSRKRLEPPTGSDRAQAPLVPGWHLERWEERLGRDAVVALVDAFFDPPPLTVRTRGDRQPLLSALGDRARSCKYAPRGVLLRNVPIAELVDGGFAEVEVQDEGSQLVSHFCAPSGGRLLDACAGLGGKTLHLAELLERKTGDGGQTPGVSPSNGSDRPTVVAMDRSRARLDRLSHRLAPDSIIDVQHADLLDSRSDIQRSTPFDLVLVDAPCSGFGTIRRRPEILWHRTAEDVEQLVRIQRSLLEAATTLVRPGGVLVYAVCTDTVDEGPDQRTWFLERFDEFEPAAPPPHAVDGELLSRGGTVMELWPHLHGTDGYYAFRMRRARKESMR